MNKRRVVLLVCFLLLISASYSDLEEVTRMNSAPHHVESPIKTILERFTRSYIEKTPQLTELTFGIKIGLDDWWTVHIRDDRSYEINTGRPDEPTFYFTTDMEILQKIASGGMHVFTAMAKAKGTDFAPMDFEVMKGFTPREDFELLEFIFHYFTIGKVEKIKFGKEFARIVHGGYAIPLIYSKGLRTGWYRIEKGMVINKEPADQLNPFPTLVIATRGRGTAKIGGQECSFSAGDAYFIPKKVTHTFWTDCEDGLEFIIIMYGEGA